MKDLGLGACVLNLLCCGCGAGVTDGERRLLGPYFIADAGGNHVTIVRKSADSGLSKIVIDARVDAVSIKEKEILVAQRLVRVSENEDGGFSEALSDECLYWKLSTLSETVQSISPSDAENKVACMR